MSAKKSKVQKLRTHLQMIEGKLLLKRTGPLQLAQMSVEGPLLRLRVLKRKNTCLEKVKRRLENEAKDHHAGLRVIKWAKRVAREASYWNLRQLKLAVTALERMEQ